MLGPGDTVYYVQDSDDDASSTHSVTADDVESRLSKIQAEHNRAVASIEARVSAMAIQQQKLQKLVRKLLEFYCAQQSSSNDACAHMYG